MKSKNKEFKTQLKLAFCIVLFSQVIICNAQTSKSVEFDFNSRAIYYNNVANYVPCLENFNINLPLTYHNFDIDSIIVNVVDTKDFDKPQKAKKYGIPKSINVDNTNKIDTNEFKKQSTNEKKAFFQFCHKSNLTKLNKNLYEETGLLKNLYAFKTNENWSVKIPYKLNRGRYYFIYLTIYYTDANANPKLITQKIETLVYTTPATSEISYIEGYTSLGALSFFNKKDNLGRKSDYQFAALVGLQLKVRPVSTNTEIKRFGLFRYWSRPGFTLGTVITETTFKQSNIKSLALGLKPSVGIMLEISSHIGLHVASVFGLQEAIPNTTDRNKIVVGMHFGLTISRKILQTTFGNNQSLATFIDNGVQTQNTN